HTHTHTRQVPLASDVAQAARRLAENQITLSLSHSLTPSLSRSLSLSWPLPVDHTRAFSRALSTQRAHAACPARTPHLIKREEDHAKDDAKEIAGKATIQRVKRLVCSMVVCAEGHL
ncbi:MAG: hypothetical protein ACPIOQ_38550, partial [Promethearchaeia archaeon]